MTLRSKLIRLAASNPELRPELLPLLKLKTAGGIPTLEDDGKKKALEAINVLMKKAKLPVKWTNFNETSISVPVPKGFSSLFSDIVINIFWSSGYEGQPHGAISWSYNHPSGGSNGKRIGGIQFEVEKGWVWYCDAFGRREWGTVG